MLNNLLSIGASVGVVLWARVLDIVVYEQESNEQFPDLWTRGKKAVKMVESDVPSTFEMTTSQTICKQGCTRSKKKKASPEQTVYVGWTIKLLGLM